MRRLVALLLFAAFALFAYGFGEATRDPVVHRAVIGLKHWPAGKPPVTVAFVSDIHAGNLVMTRARLSSMVDIVEAARPDLVVIAGDFVAGDGEAAARRAAPMLAALSRLHAPLGVVAVLGNHDHSTDAAMVRAALERAGVTVLDNAAVTRGPLAIAGVDDMVTDHDDEPAAVAAARALPGAPLMVSHAPNAIYRLPPDIRLVLAGHTHCGQLVLPLIGAPFNLAEPRYRCGLVRQGDQVTIVTAGLGTSVVPLRIGAPPDLWLIRLGPIAASAP